MSVKLQCPDCGREYEGKARFCRADGARLVEVSVSISATALPAVDPAQAQSESAKRESPAADSLGSVRPVAAATSSSRRGGAASTRSTGASGDALRISNRDLRSSGIGGAGTSRATSMRGLPGVSADDLGLPGAISGEYRKFRSSVTSTGKKDPRKESKRDHSGLLQGPIDPSHALRADASRHEARSESRAEGRTEPRPDPMIGRLIGGRFLIDKVLGAGATGVVYRATHRALGRKMAVKLLKPQFVWDDRSLERFFREARTYSLLDHPNIVYLYDFGRGEQGEPFLVMEYVEGQTLHQAIQESITRTLPLDRVLMVMSQLARALEHAHSRGVIHRDIKPENIMLVRQGEYEDLAKLLDFGVARLANSDRVTGVGQVTGTAEFIAPETLHDTGEITSAVDLYAIGMIFHDALVGRPPFTGTLDVVLHQHLEVVPPLLSERSGDPNLPAELDEVVARLLEKDPALRPTAHELSGVLDRMLEEWLGREYAVDDSSISGGIRLPDVSDLDTQRLAVYQRPTVMFHKTERKTEISDRLERPTQIVARQDWPTRMLQVSSVNQGTTAKPTQVLLQRPPRALSLDQLEVVELHSSTLHKTATDLAGRMWPGGWPQALLNLQQHIDNCDEQDRKLTAEIESHERRVREAPELLERHNALRMKVLHLSERLRNETTMDARARMKLCDELEAAERVFFTLESSIQPLKRRSNIEAQRQSRIDVRATRRRSRVMFARLLLAMPCQAALETAKHDLQEILTRCDQGGQVKT